MKKTSTIFLSLVSGLAIQGCRSTNSITDDDDVYYQPHHDSLQYSSVKPMYRDTSGGYYIDDDGIYYNPHINFYVRSGWGWGWGRPWGYDPYCTPRGQGWFHHRDCLQNGQTTFHQHRNWESSGRTTTITGNVSMPHSSTATPRGGFGHYGSFHSSAS